jgi:hypothetical protein
MMNGGLNGQVVEIKVLERDSEYDDLINGSVVKTVENEPAWTVSDFLRWFPDRSPQLSVEAFEEGLARIAQLPQYAEDQ